MHTQQFYCLFGHFFFTQLGENCKLLIFSYHVDNCFQTWFKVRVLRGGFIIMTTNKY